MSPDVALQFVYLALGVGVAVGLAFVLVASLRGGG